MEHFAPLVGINADDCTIVTVYGECQKKDENTVNTVSCGYCLHCMDGADDLKRCRINGLKATAANAEDCSRFMDVALDYMLADMVRPWCGK